MSDIMLNGFFFVMNPMYRHSKSAFLQMTTDFEIGMIEWILVDDIQFQILFSLTNFAMIVNYHRWLFFAMSTGVNFQYLPQKRATNE